MTDADELRCKHCKAKYDRRQEKKCGGYCFDCWNCGVPELIEDRDRLAAENADLKAVKVAYEEAPKDARNATTAGVTWETLQGTVGRVIDSQTIRDLRAENARLLAILISCDTVMDTAAIHGVDDILPPAYRDSWATVHMAVREALTRKEG